MNRIDIALSILTKETDKIKIANDENDIKSAIGRILYDMGYEKFIVIDGQYIDSALKKVIEIVWISYDKSMLSMKGEKYES